MDASLTARQISGCLWLKTGGRNGVSGPPAYSFYVPRGEGCWQGALTFTKLETCWVSRTQSSPQWPLSLWVTVCTHLFILCMGWWLILEHSEKTFQGNVGLNCKTGFFALNSETRECWAGFEKPDRFVAETAFDEVSNGSIVGVEEGAAPALDYNQTVICVFLW